MKIVFAIINNSDMSAVTGALTKAGYSSTVTNSNGGFFNRENSILFVGVDDNRVQSVLAIIKQHTHTTEVNVPENVKMGDFMLPSKVRVGGAVVFVMDVDQFVKL
jgi:uncharacterized protein YaaQ